MSWFGPRRSAADTSAGAASSFCKSTGKLVAWTARKGAGSSIKGRSISNVGAAGELGVATGSTFHVKRADPRDSPRNRNSGTRCTRIDSPGVSWSGPPGLRCQQPGCRPRRADRAPGRGWAGEASAWRLNLSPPRRADRTPGRVEMIPLPSRPLDPHGGVAIEDADRAAAVQVQHALVVDVGAKADGGGVPGDGAGVVDRHRAVVGDAAATVGGDVAGQGAAADRQRAVVAVVDAAAGIAGGVAGQGAAADRQRTGPVVDTAAIAARSLLAKLPDRVLLLTVSVPLCLKMPPPAELTVLLDRVLPLTVSVPLFQMPPPSAWRSCRTGCCR